MKTTVDWFKFRTRSNPFEILDSIRPAFGTVGHLLDFGKPEKGKDGWEHRRCLVLGGDQLVAKIDYGGESQRGWVRFDMSGDGCEWIQDWQAVVDAAGRLLEAEIRRLDIALTVSDGSIDHERCVQAHAQGQFTNFGRSPKARQVLPTDGRDGRTLYVGRREGSRYFRCYEKGWEMISKLPESLRNSVSGVELHGVLVPPEKIYRVEVELKADEGSYIPWLAVTSTDEFFAGTCPFLASLLPAAKPVKIQKLPDFRPKIEAIAALEHCRVAYGGALRAVFAAGLMTREEILDAVMGEAPSPRLVRSGVLSLESL